MESSDLLRRREENILRNDEMLRMLGFGSSTMMKATTKSVTGDKKLSIKGKSNSGKESTSSGRDRDRTQREVARKEHLNHLLCTIMHRNEEIQTLSSYLSEGFSPSPALLVDGFSGCGKSLVVESVVAGCGTPYVIFPCTGFSSSRNLLKSVWQSIICALREYHAPKSYKTIKDEDDHDSTSSYDHHHYKSGTADSVAYQATEFNKAPSTFGDFVHYMSELVKVNYSDFRLIIVFDKIDATNVLEKGLSSRLLRLGSLCHPMIKVVGINAVISYKSCDCLFLPFAAYSDTEMNDILKNALEEKKKSEDGSAADQDGMNVILTILKNAMPRLCAITKHMGELKRTIDIIYMKLQERILKRSTEQVIDRNSITPRLKEIVDELIHLPIMHLETSSDTVIKAQTTKVNNSGSNKRSRSKSIFHGSISVPEEWQEYHALIQRVEPTTLCGKTSCTDLPTSRKYLLLAAYLASNNPKETDDHVFAFRKKGKRRKEKAGSDSSSQEVMGPKPFTLERLLSIFSQISIIAETNNNSSSLFLEVAQDINALQVAKIVEKKYGDTTLFAAVNDLENQRYLKRAPGWSLDKPLYLSFVQLSMATQLAQLVNFDLAAYCVY